MKNYVIVTHVLLIYYAYLADSKKKESETVTFSLFL